jgi:hypothetical protein
MFNPTNCSPQSFSGTALSTEGAVASILSHFKVESCQSLKFKPDLKVSTAGKTSKRYGASLDAKVIYPPVALGANQAAGQANIARVKVDLPKQLPSRLTTFGARSRFSRVRPTLAAQVEGCCPSVFEEASPHA